MSVSPDKYEHMLNAARRVYSEHDMRSLQPGDLYVFNSHLHQFDGVSGIPIRPSAQSYFDGAGSGAAQLEPADFGEEESQEEEEEEQEQPEYEPQPQSGYSAYSTRNPNPSLLPSRAPVAEEEELEEEEDVSGGEESDSDGGEDEDEEGGEEGEEEEYAVRTSDHDVLDCGDYPDGQGSEEESCDL
jgi:hypothetical protein